MLQLLKVHGHSLYPQVRDGDYVVVAKRFFRSGKIKVGDLIVFHQPGYGRLIKRVQRVLDDGKAYDVRGTQIESTDSRDFGPIACQAVSGKVIWHIRQR